MLEKLQSLQSDKEYIFYFDNLLRFQKPCMMELVRLLLITMLISLLQLTQGNETSNTDNSISFKKNIGSPSRQASSDFLTASSRCFQPLRYSFYRIGYNFKSRYNVIAYSRADIGKLTYVMFTCSRCTAIGRVGNLLNDAGVSLSEVKAKCAFAGNRGGSSARPVYDCANSSVESIAITSLLTCTTKTTSDFHTASTKCFQPLRYSFYRMGYNFKSPYNIVAYSRMDVGKLTYVMFTCNKCITRGRAGNLLNAAGVSLSAVKVNCAFAGNRGGSSVRPVYDCATSSLDRIITSQLVTCPHR